METIEISWKDIPGYERIYKCCSAGIIASYPRVQHTNIRNNSLCIRKEQKLKPTLTRFGYLRIALYRNGKSKKFHVHQIVALCFCNGFFEGAQVNHKDGNKLNNNWNNLEWVTPSGNMKHAFETGLNFTTDKKRKAISKRHSGGGNVNARKVIDTETGQVYDCINDAAMDKNISVWNLYAYLRGVNKNKTSLKYA